MSQLCSPDQPRIHCVVQVSLELTETTRLCYHMSPTPHYDELIKTGKESWRNTVHSLIDGFPTLPVAALAPTPSAAFDDPVVLCVFLRP